MKNNSTILQFLASVGQPYEERFLKPLWNRYPAHESNDWDALIIFLSGYAFARQGAPSDFSHAACDAIEQVRQSYTKPTDHSSASALWTAFSDLLNNSNLNYANNPLCPKGTNYPRKFKGTSRTAKTSCLSVTELLGTLALESRTTNILVYAKENLQRDNLAQAHQALCRIGGIADKIASLFLRDVAIFYRICPQKERHLLQPIDVWVRNMSSQLMGGLAPDEEIRRWIVQEATRSGVNAEAVNEGMWYFGSQVSKSQYRVSCALSNLEYARDLLNEHVEDLRLALLAWDQILAGL